MSVIRDVLLFVPSFSLGAVLVGMFGLPLAYRRGRARTEDETRLFEGVALARDHKPVHPLVEETLPVQHGTHAEHGRLLAIAATPHRQPQKAVAGLWERLDRLASTPRLDPLCDWLGRRERHWWNDYATGAHATVVPDARPATAILARLAIERQTGLLPILAEHGRLRPALPPIDYSAYTEVTAPALLGLTDEGPIPVAHIGELVEAT